MLFVIFLQLFCLGQSLDYPKSLPDPNGDGKSDLSDWFVTFRQMYLSQYDINLMFQVIDKNRDGLVDENEWQEFYTLFSKPFQLCDINKTFHISEEELTKCFDKSLSLKNLQTILDHDAKIKPTNTQTLLAQLTSSSRLDPLFPRINLAEFIFLKRATLAFMKCTTDRYYISRQEIKNCAMKYMISNMQNTNIDVDSLVNTGFMYVDQDQIVNYQNIRFAGFIQMFNKYNQFRQFLDSNLRVGALGMSDFIDGLNSGRLPNEKLNDVAVRKLFINKGKQEEYGLDFRAFMILYKQLFLVSTVDLVILYGEKKNGFLYEDEFEKILDLNVLNRNLTQYIDFCQNDTIITNQLKDKTEKLPYQLDPQEDELRREENLFANKFRFKNKQVIQYKPVVKNPLARKTFFRIYDYDQDGLFDSIDFFTMIKMQMFFQAFDHNGQHLISQNYNYGFGFDWDSQHSNYLVYTIPLMYHEKQNVLNVILLTVVSQNGGAKTSNKFPNVFCFIYLCSSFSPFIKKSQNLLNLVSSHDGLVSLPVIEGVLNLYGFKLTEKDLVNTKKSFKQVNELQAYDTIEKQIQINQASKDLDDQLYSYPKVIRNVLNRYGNTIVRLESHIGPNFFNSYDKPKRFRFKHKNV